MNNKESFVDLYTVLGIERTSTYDEGSLSAVLFSKEKIKNR